MKKIAHIILLLIMFVLLLSGCATQRKTSYHNDMRGLMLLDNTQLGRNRLYNSSKYHKTLKHNYKKITNKR